MLLHTTTTPPTTKENNNQQLKQDNIHKLKPLTTFILFDKKYAVVC